MMNSTKRRLTFQTIKACQEYKRDNPHWFEGAVTAEGKLLRADVSHLTTLSELAGLTMEEAYDRMKITDSPLMFLL